MSRCCTLGSEAGPFKPQCVLPRLTERCRRVSFPLPTLSSLPATAAPTSSGATCWNGISSDDGGGMAMERKSGVRACCDRFASHLLRRRSSAAASIKVHRR